MFYVKMDFKIKVFIYCLVFMCINSCAQENQIMNINSLSAIEEDVNFYDALRQRSDLNFGRNIRILYTTIKNIQEFQENYQDSDMHLDYVIRNRLHTAIYLNQEKNYLESMDGSIFNLPQNINASKLTDEVVKLIGGMYYGSSEVRELINN